MGHSSQDMAANGVARAVLEARKTESQAHLETCCCRP
jgi:hypothetical protein